QKVVVDPDRTMIAPAGGGEASQGRDARLIEQNLKGHYLHVLPAALVQGAQHAAPGTAVAFQREARWPAALRGHSSSGSSPAAACQCDAIERAARHVPSSSSSSSATARILSRV